MFGFTHRRRRRLRARPFPEEWRRILERNVPHYRCLPEADREELHGHINVFLHEKHFMGAGGLEMTDEIRLTIAAQACMLLLHRDSDYYRGLSTIIVYPSKYVATSKSIGSGGIVTESTGVRLGESWQRPGGNGVGGPVVLSWSDVKRGAADPGDGHNVVFHEFAHQLDGEDGGVQGAPRLPERSMYRDWARVLGGEYEELLEDLRTRKGTVLDPYAAESPAEFFAVATETFFERPIELRNEHPELYQQLQKFYAQDPASLRERCGIQSE